jgi:hypothetical protein
MGSSLRSGTGWQWRLQADPGAVRANAVDRLDQAGESWKLYTQNYSWAICPTFGECLNSCQAKNTAKTLTGVNDATNGTLPASSVILPNTASGEGAGTATWPVPDLQSGRSPRLRGGRTTAGFGRTTTLAPKPGHRWLLGQPFTSR